MSYILLLRTDPNDRFETREEPGSRLLIGRGPQSHLRLDDDTVAVEHATIEDEDGRYILTDRGSVTGTYVNGKRIEKVQLAAGDKITIGAFSLKAEFLQQFKGPLILDVRQVGGSAAEAEGAATDYAAAYGLRRKFFNQAILTWLSTAAGVVVVAGVLFAGKTHVFQPGGLSKKHSSNELECASCHVAWHGPSEKACEKCHPAPLHHQNQAFTPPCVSCHAEHRGQIALAAVGNQNCLQCHADLKHKGDRSGQSQFENKITDFSRDHPEFAIALADGRKRIRLSEKGARQSDLAKMKLNHELHLKPGLKTPRGTVQLTCQNCHKPALDERRMAPVTYEAHCKECHELGFDDQYPNRQVPHDSPEIVRSYLLRVYAELSDEMLRRPEVARSFPLSSSPDKLDPSIIRKVRNAESHLYEVTCKECHEIDLKEGALPVVEKTGVPVVWHGHARFAHKSHRMLECESCHKGVSQSQKTTDVLLPGIERCRECHRQERLGLFSRKSNAPTDCADCHIYHDRSKGMDWAKPLPGTASLDPAKSGKTKAGSGTPTTR